MSRLFQFRCSICQHEDDVWVDDPTMSQACPACEQKSFQRVWSFSARRSGQECPPGSR